MINFQNKARALGLCSGGLDSILAAVILKNQGVSVEWITFETPFFSSEKARNASAQLNIPLTVLNITHSYLSMLKNPRCGYGQNMNPCMDCHALMFRIAGNEMKEKKMDFLFSGEVLGQRPMSQTRSSLKYVEKHSGFKGYIVRPLSARLLDETDAEKNGLIRRDFLLGLSGRSRKPQIDLARQWGISGYPAPAGGCLLTDRGFSRRLKDLFDHQSEYTEDELHLLRYGRHLRMNEQIKIIVGRTQQDNAFILSHWNPLRDTLLKTVHIPGPIALVPHGSTHDNIRQAAIICAGYSKADEYTPVRIQVISPSGSETLQVAGKRPDGEHMI